MDETKEINAQADVEQNADEELIAKKVYDDTVAAYETKLKNYEENEKILKKQVDDYSKVLRKLNVVAQKEPERSSDELFKIMTGGK